MTQALATWAVSVVVEGPAEARRSPTPHPAPRLPRRRLEFLPAPCQEGRSRVCAPIIRAAPRNLSRLPARRAASECTLQRSIPLHLAMPTRRKIGFEDKLPA